MFTTLVNSARVLLVEDSPTDVKLFQVAAKKTRWISEVTVAADGQEGLDLLKAGGRLPHLVFLDLNMPRLNGLEFLELIKADSRLRRIPVVVLTTSSAPKDILAAYDRQTNCFLTKPPDFPGFTKMLEEVEDFWFRLASIPTDY